DVEQEGDRDEQDERGDELDDRDSSAVEPREAEHRAGEHAELRPEEDLEAAEATGPAPRERVAADDPSPSGVGVGEEDERAGLLVAALGDHVLGGAPAERAPYGRDPE